MIVREKIIRDFQIYMDSEGLAYTVVVRKFGEQPIFSRVYSCVGSARRAYKRWCSRIGHVNCSEVRHEQ